MRLLDNVLEYARELQRSVWVREVLALLYPLVRRSRMVARLLVSAVHFHSRALDCKVQDRPSQMIDALVTRYTRTESTAQCLGGVDLALLYSLVMPVRMVACLLMTEHFRRSDK